MKFIKFVHVSKKTISGICALIFFMMFLILAFVVTHSSLGARTITDPYCKSPTFTVSGKVIKKEELWDRRGNPLMGRPDFLKEIIFHIHVDSVIKGPIPGNYNPVTVSVKDQKNLIKYKTIAEGKNGVFTLCGEAMPFFLIEAIPSTIDNLPETQNQKDSTANGSNQKNPPVNNRPTKKDPMAMTDDEFLAYIDKISGRDIRESEPLQKRAAQAIAQKYGMENARVVILVSFSGPMPPQGGYVYWGVSGQIDGKWYVWQPWTDWTLRPGNELEDPKRYQKCNSPQTKILTVSGYVAIADIKVGDLLIGETGQYIAVLKVSRLKVTNHHVSRVQFDNGTIVEISPTHPLADGRLLGQLKPGDEVGKMRVTNSELIFYEHEYTYDILPDSPSANYYAEGILLKSTLSLIK